MLSPILELNWVDVTDRPSDIYIYKLWEKVVMITVTRSSVSSSAPTGPPMATAGLVARPPHVLADVERRVDRLLHQQQALAQQGRRRYPPQEGPQLRVRRKVGRMHTFSRRAWRVFGFWLCGGEYMATGVGLSFSLTLRDKTSLWQVWQPGIGWFLGKWYRMVYNFRETVISWQSNRPCHIFCHHSWLLLQASQSNMTVLRDETTPALFTDSTPD